MADLASPFGQLVASGSEFANKRGLYLGRRSTMLHVALYRCSRGRLGNHIPGWPEARIALVDHTGARSGVKRTSPVMYLRDGESVVVMASKAGQPSHPAWYHNLKANPETTVQIGPMLREVRARIAGPEERGRLWRQFLELYPPAEAYQRNAGARQIPIVVLEPRL
ncbi:MAG: nitroreductase family deazaflavin-dependent oxidoreductase [Solirubrobacterales bacterium]